MIQTSQTGLWEEIGKIIEEVGKIINEGMFFLRETVTPSFRMGLKAAIETALQGKINSCNFSVPNPVWDGTRVIGDASIASLLNPGRKLFIINYSLLIVVNLSSKK